MSKSQSKAPNEASTSTLGGVSTPESSTSEEELLGNSAVLEAMPGAETGTTSMLNAAAEEGGQESELPTGIELLRASEAASDGVAAMGSLEGALGGARDTAENIGIEVNPNEASTLASAAPMNAFVEAAREIQAEWDAKNPTSSAEQDSPESLEASEQSASGATSTSTEISAVATPDTASSSSKEGMSDIDRRTSLFAEAGNTALETVGVHKLLSISAQEMSADGMFIPSEWSVELNPKPLGGEPTEVPAVAETMYHEIRHAEQFHLMMRLKSGENRDLIKANGIGLGDLTVVNQLVNTMGVPNAVAKHAVERPLEAEHPMRDKVLEFYDDVYGAGAEARSNAHYMMELAKKFATLTSTIPELVDFPGAQTLIAAKTNLANRWEAFIQRWFGTDESYREAIEKYEEVKKELEELKAEMEACGISAWDAYESYLNESVEIDARQTAEAMRDQLDQGNA